MSTFLFLGVIEVLRISTGCKALLPSTGVSLVDASFNPDPEPLEKYRLIDLICIKGYFPRQIVNEKLYLPNRSNVSYI